MTTVKIDNGDVLNFPDDMSDSEISSAIDKEYGSSPSEQNSKLQTFNNITGANRTPVDILRDLLSGALTGAAKGGEFLNRQEMRIPGAQNLAQTIRNKLGITANVSDQDVNQMLQQVASPNKSIGGGIAQGIGEYVPYAPIGGVSSVAAKVLPRVAPYLGEAAAGGAFGAAIANPDQSSGKNALIDALINVGTRGALDLGNAARPSNLLRGNLSDKQLQANLEAARGNAQPTADDLAKAQEQIGSFSATPDQVSELANQNNATRTNLGSVIGNPFLKKTLYENLLSYLPLSGAASKAQVTGDLIKNQANDLLTGVLGNNKPANITSQISDVLNQQFKSNKALKNSLYDNVNDLADQSNLQLSLPTFAKKAQDYSDAINQTNILKYEPDVAKIFNKLQNYKNPVSETRNVGSIVDQSGKPIIDETQVNAPTLQEANILKGKLNDYAKTARYSPDASQRYAANVFSDLASSLKGDIKSSIEDSGNEDLKSAYNDAESNYAKNYSPFLNKKIYKYVSGNPSADSDRIAQDFITTSNATDQANKLNQLSKILPDSKKGLLGYAYFSRALDNEGNLKPSTLSALISKLGKNQFKALVPDDALRSKIQNWNRLYKITASGVDVMANPKTGNALLSLLPAALAHTGSAIAGGAIGSLPGALLGLIAPGIAARPLVNALTSPAVRESLVRKMIANQPWSKKPIPYLQAALQSRTLNNQQGS